MVREAPTTPRRSESARAGWAPHNNVPGSAARTAAPCTLDSGRRTARPGSDRKTRRAARRAARRHAVVVLPAFRSGTDVHVPPDPCGATRSVPHDGAEGRRCRGVSSGGAALLRAAAASRIRSKGTSATAPCHASATGEPSSNKGLNTKGVSVLPFFQVTDKLAIPQGAEAERSSVARISIDPAHRRTVPYQRFGRRCGGPSIPSREKSRSDPAHTS